MIAKIPVFIQMCYPGRTWTGPSENEKNLFLTFDDGPIPEVTPWVLEQLKKFNAQATFFCIGDNVRKYPEIFRALISDGHSIGNHTYHHLNGWQTPTDVYLDNVQKGEEILQEHIPGLDNTIPQQRFFFRPPYGKLRHKQARALKKLGYRIIMWDVLSLDYDRTTSSEACYLNVVENAREGSIIIFHDSLKAEKNLRACLPQVLEHYHEKGFSFKALQ